MNIKRTKPRFYKNYFIVGEAIEAPILKGWRLRGIIYTKSRKELKQLELKQATFWHKRIAQYYAVRMCRYWIDNYRSELERLLKAPRKAIANGKKVKLSIQAHRWTLTPSDD
jgi:hypothetical protein